MILDSHLIETPKQEPGGTIVGKAPADQATRCENCCVQLTGAFCASCGQSGRSPVVSLRAFASQVLDEVVSLDSRLLRTMRALFLKPGHLTREYLDGRRVRYTQPVQLYLLAAAAFFLMASYRPFVRVDTDRRQVIGQLPGMVIGNDLANERLEELAVNPLALELFAERFGSAINGVLPVFLLGSVVLFSFVVYGVNRNHESRYLAHVVFALHWTAFYLIVIALARLFPPQWMVQDIAQIPVLLYLTLALRHVYAQGTLLSFGKGLLLMFLFLITLAIWVQSAITIGMRTA